MHAAQRTEVELDALDADARAVEAHGRSQAGKEREQRKRSRRLYSHGGGSRQVDRLTDRRRSQGAQPTTETEELAQSHRTAKREFRQGSRTGKRTGKDKNINNVRTRQVVIDGEMDGSGCC